LPTHEKEFSALMGLFWRQQTFTAREHYWKTVSWKTAWTCYISVSVEKQASLYI